MDTKIKEIKAVKPMAKFTRVCAYARVSTAKDAMLNSLSNQISYYSNLIQSHNGWAYAGVYADEGISGTLNTRDKFNEMIEDCEAGKIDMIITKSISRFARNTVVLLSTLRKLKELNINVYFEEQNINSMSADGELMITILASYAQEEARSVSENMKWRVRANFKKGIPWNGTVLGYRLVNGKYEIQEDEAKIVRLIFDLYLKGMGKEGIARYLNKLGVVTRFKNKWSKESVITILKNRIYSGNLLLQTTYHNNYIEKKSVKNNGELPMYRVEESHDAIIDIDTFNKVQAEIKRRADKLSDKETKANPSPLNKLVICANCGKFYRRKNTKYRLYWMCETYSMKGKDACPSAQIPDEILINLTKEALNLKTLDNINLHELLIKVEIHNERLVKFYLQDGTVVEKTWNYESRSKSWTPEMKEQARQRELERKRKLCQE